MRCRILTLSAGLTLAIGMLLIGGCNIVHGIGQEVTAIGKGISNVTNDVHPYKEASAGRSNATAKVK